MDQNGFIAWRIAEFVGKTLPAGIDLPPKWKDASYPRLEPLLHTRRM